MQRYKLHSMIISLHDYFFFSVISHVKIVILTHIVEIRRLKVKYIVNIIIFKTVRRARAVNAQRANVGPAG